MIAYAPPFENWMWNALAKARMKTNRKRILVLEDDEEQLHFLSRTLEPTRAFIEGCKAVSQARKCLEIEIPDLVLADLNLQKQESGFSLLAQLQQDSKLRQVPVIVYSASCNPETRDRARRLGAVDFLAKPAPPIEIIRSAAFHLKG